MRARISGGGVGSRVVGTALYPTLYDLVVVAVGLLGNSPLRNARSALVVFAAPAEEPPVLGAGDAVGVTWIGPCGPGRFAIDEPARGPGDAVPLGPGDGKVP